MDGRDMPYGVNAVTGKPGPAPMLPRDGDKAQARQRINVEVRTNYRPHANALPCVDCGHIWAAGERRHEYDHYLGYAAVHHYDVQSVCTLCHSRRSFERGEITAEMLRAGGQARAAQRTSHCAKGHPMGRMSDGKWRCHECRILYWRNRNAGRAHG